MRKLGAAELAKTLLATGAALGAVTLSACGGESEDATPPRHIECLSNDLAGRSLQRTMEVPGENFTVTASYSTDYNVNQWKITDSKTLDIKLEVTPTNSETLPTVLVENLHADAAIYAPGKQGINGLKQDTFDDHLHAGDQPGFLVSPEHPYTEEFVIEGYSETLLNAWGSMYSGYGAFSAEEKRLTEKELLEQGAKGEKFNLVVDLLMKNATETYFHKEVVDDEFVVPLPGFKC